MFQINHLINFLNSAWSSYHTHQSIQNKLIEHQFVSGSSNKNSENVFVSKDETLVAFKKPTAEIKRIKLIATHIDSPHLKLKLTPKKTIFSYQQWLTEVYGSPLLYSWLDRDLQVAGKLLFKDALTISSKLTDHVYPIAKIPSLAIHMQREINQDGLKLNPQQHLNALISLNDKDILLQLCNDHQIDYKDLLSFDLQLSDAQPATLLGKESDLLSAGKLDNLLMTYLALESFLESKNDENSLKICVFFNHEEVGSQSPSGADSLFLDTQIKHFLSSQQISSEKWSQILNNSNAISADMAHGIHPAYMQKHDTDIFPQLGKGPVIKINQNMKYASTASNVAIIVDLCQRNEIPFQYFYNRQDLNCGTTVGPIISALTGISTVDIGNAMLGMHSIRETASVRDADLMFRLMSSFFEN